MHKKLAPTPPMGWNSWDCYGAAVNEEQLLANADYMAEHLKEYGWEYVVCDIQWSEPTANSFYYHYFAPLCMDEYEPAAALRGFLKGFSPASSCASTSFLKVSFEI